MEERRENIELEELFRRKLENSELLPADSLRPELMKRLARREFFRFNPAEVNIYYISGILAVAVTAGLMLLPGKPDKIKQDVLKDTKPGSELVMPAQPVQNSETGDFDKAEVKEKSIAGTNRKTGSDRNTPNISVNGNEKRETGNQAAKATDTIRKESIIKETAERDKVRNVTIRRNPLADFEASVISGCSPLQVRFLNRSESYDSCRWQFGDGGYSGLEEPVWIFDNAGEYKVTLKVFGYGGNSSSKTVSILVHPKPVARFGIYPEKPIIPDDELRFTNNSTDAVRYLWDFGDNRTSESYEPVHKYNRYRDYSVRLIVWSEYGCTDSITLKSAFSGSGCFINFPNAFIPNSEGPSGGNYSSRSDESAQIFHPVTSGVSEYQLRIFSKIGILIFESNDINIGWDGYHKGQLCEPGVYVWKVRGTFKNGELFVKMGDLTLLKQ